MYGKQGIVKSRDQTRNPSIHPQSCQQLDQLAQPQNTLNG